MWLSHLQSVVASPQSAKALVQQRSEGHVMGDPIRPRQQLADDANGTAKRFRVHGRTDERSRTVVERSRDGGWMWMDGGWARKPDLWGEVHRSLVFPFFRSSLQGGSAIDKRQSIRREGFPVCVC